MSWRQLPVESACFAGLIELWDWKVTRGVITDWSTCDQTVHRETMNLLTAYLQRCMRTKNFQSWCFQKQQEECLAHVRSFNYREETEAIYSQCVSNVSGDKRNKNTLSVLSVPSLFSPFIILPHTSCHPAFLSAIFPPFVPPCTPPTPPLLKLLLAVNTFLISSPANLRCERKGIKICIILERNRAVTLWTQGWGEQLLA